MQYNISFREKDNSWQYIISYKDKYGKWKQKSKQGFSPNKQGKQAAKDAAKEELEKLKLEVESDLPIEYSGITFKDFCTNYIEHSKLYCAYKTVLSTETTVHKFSALYDYTLSGITTLDIQKLVDNFLKEGLNPNTIRYYIKKLNIIFNAAKNQYKIISNNPTKNLILNKPEEINKRALNDNEVSALLESTKNSKYYLLIYIAVNTGMRLGEILGLTWDDINIKENRISVNKQWKICKDDKYGFGKLKSKNSKRVIPISKKVTEEILKFKKVIGIPNKDVTSDINNRIFRDFNSTMSTCCRINTILKDLGFNISFHELRHTYATKIIANGMDWKTAANILGHDVQQTIKTYSHVNQDMITKAQNLIENIF